MNVRRFSSDPAVEARKSELDRQIRAVMEKHRLACEQQCRPLVDELAKLAAMDDRAIFEGVQMNTMEWSGD